MPTIILRPSATSVSNSTYLHVSYENLIWDEDESTCALIPNNASSTTYYYAYISGFDFSSIPSDAIITSAEVKVVASAMTRTTVAKPVLYNGTTSASSLAEFDSGISTSKTTLTATLTGTNFNTYKGYGSNARVRVTVRRSSASYPAQIYLYEVYIVVNYDVNKTKVGDTSTNKFMVGTEEVDKIYLGKNLLYGG